MSHWKTLRDFAYPPGKRDAGWKQPFPHQVAAFPEKRITRASSRAGKVIATVGDTFGRNNNIAEPGLNSVAHISPHLPSLPPAHTYKRTRTQSQHPQGTTGAGTSTSGVSASSASGTKVRRIVDAVSSKTSGHKINPPSSDEANSTATTDVTSHNTHAGDGVLISSGSNNNIHIAASSSI